RAIPTSLAVTVVTNSPAIALEMMKSSQAEVIMLGGRVQPRTGGALGIMTISYGNSEEESQGHTGTQLRIAAYGPHAANVVGLTDQTDLSYT
ncbi:alkaline phosphatase, partial [Dickeya dianthicola]|uniref:alkaline phosphatase n=1 Tax=Dickeya dianthicola TaxID=204039 RepID=UPI000551EE6C